MRRTAHNEASLILLRGNTAIVKENVMEATILFPGDYFSPEVPASNYRAEFEAAAAVDGIRPMVFNFEEYIEGAPLRIYGDASSLPELPIYRGWMMTPDQYERFYIDLVSRGFDPLTKPLCYDRMHRFPSVYEMFKGQTPRIMTFPVDRGRVAVDADLVNKAFKRFMVKDYVKSVKGTSFPQYIDTPIKQEKLDALIDEFIRLRGSLFTGGIVLKEHVNLKRYGGTTNEWRMFCFVREMRLALAKNTNQPESCPKPPEEYLSTRNFVVCPFYTVDFAELEDGSWTIIEAGDGQVSGLAESDNPARFYETMSRCLNLLDK